MRWLPCSFCWLVMVAANCWLSVGILAAAESPPLVLPENGAAATTAEDTVTSPPPVPAAQLRHTFQAGEIRRYLSETVQTVEWTSAGETLKFRSTLQFHLSCYAKSVTAEKAELVWRVLDIVASHSGPGGNETLDSTTGEGVGGALLGDLMVYRLAPLTMTVDLASGAVSHFSGHELLIQRMNERHPSSNPVNPPPRDAAAKRAFSAENLSRFFERMLTTPRSTAVPLDLGPAAGAATATWSGNTYSVALTKGVEPVITLHTDPTPVQLHIVALSGNGELSMADGIVQRHAGDAAFTISGSALTQGVQQQHTLHWQLVLLSRGQSEPQSTP